MHEHETIVEATAAKEGGEAAFWHRQIQDAGKVEREPTDWHRAATCLHARRNAGGTGLGWAGNPLVERIVNERAEVRHVYWSDFRMSPARC